MAIPEQHQQEINKFVQAIRKVAKEVQPNIKVKDEKIVGLLIIMFPEDHDTTAKITTTVIGKICFNHTVEFLAELKAETVTKANKLAT